MRTRNHTDLTSHVGNSVAKTLSINSNILNSTCISPLRHGLSSWTFVTAFSSDKTKKMVLSASEIISTTCLAVLTQYRNVSDKRADGRN